MVIHHDLTPLFRSSIGYDRMADLLNGLISEQVSGTGYPPYNIEKIGDNNYRITMAVAGFSDNDIDINTQEDMLIVRGRTLNDNEVDSEREFLHRGIAERAFERQFSLADNVKVVGASLVNGILDIDLEREIPESKKPRKITISTNRPKKSLEPRKNKSITNGTVL